jgi:hypothetical protein
MAGGPQARCRSMLHSEAMATLQSPGLEDLPPSSSCHAFPESVHPFAPPRLRLPGSFRHSNPSSVKITTADYTLFWPLLQNSCEGRNLACSVAPPRGHGTVPLLY